MKHILPLPFCVLALGLAGCVSYRPAPLDARRALTELSARSVEVIFGADGAPPVGSFNLSDGLNERELIAVALRLNTDLAAARAGVGESRAALLAAGLFPDPELGASYQPGVGDTDGFNADIDLMFELLRFGERGAKQDAARAAVDASTAAVAAREYDVATEVRRQLTVVLAAEQELILLDQELALRRQSLELIQRRREAGEANALDVAASQLELTEIERERRQAAARLPVERAKLNRLLGLTPNYELRLSDSGRPLEVRLIDVPDESTIRASVLSGRLDLVEKAADYRRAEQELRLEVIRQYPSLKIGPAFSHEGEDENFFGLGVAIDVPLLNRNRGEIAAKLAQRDRVRAEYVDRLHQMAREAAVAAAAVASMRAEVDAQRNDLLPLLEQNERLYRGALDARELSVVDFVLLQQRTLQARRAHLRTLTDYRTALIELDGAAGLTLTGIRPSQSTSPPLNPTKQEKP